jgi:hypothetical protein
VPSWQRGHNQPVTTQRTGLCILRAWVEPGSLSPLRVRIRFTTDVSQGLQQSLTVADQDVVVEAVQAWLSAMLAGSPTGEDDSDSPPNP